jgi:hypothetical protein
MKYTWLVVVTLFTFFLTSCSDLYEDKTLVSYQVEKTSQFVPSSPFTYLSTFSSVEIKEWRLSNMDEGIIINFGTNMDNYDFVFAIIENTQSQNSELVFLQKVQNEYLLPNREIFEVKDIRVYGVYTSQEIGNYPYSYLQDFSNLVVEDWTDGGSALKVICSEWNSTSKDMFAELNSSSGNILVYIGNPGSKEFELPTFNLKDIKGINLFATLRSSEIPMDKSTN